MSALLGEFKMLIANEVHCLTLPIKKIACLPFLKLSRKEKMQQLAYSVCSVERDVVFPTNAIILLSVDRQIRPYLHIPFNIILSILHMAERRMKQSLLPDPRQLLARNGPFLNVLCSRPTLTRTL